MDKITHLTELLEVASILPHRAVVNPVRAAKAKYFFLVYYCLEAITPLCAANIVSTVSWFEYFATGNCKASP